MGLRGCVHRDHRDCGRQTPYPRTSFTLALALAFLVAGAGTYGFAQLLARRADRVLIDPATNERVILRRDSLFSIPVRFWTWIFIALGVAMMLMAVFRS